MRISKLWLLEEDEHGLPHWLSALLARLARTHARRLPARLRSDPSVPREEAGDPKEFLRQLARSLPEKLLRQPDRARHAFTWLVDRYVHGGIRMAEDMRSPESRAMRALEIWADKRNRHNLGLPDKLTGYPDLVSLERETTVRDSETGRPPTGRLFQKAMSRPEVAEGTELIYDGPHYMVVEVTSYPAARFWGSGTHWCTVPNRSECESYLLHGPLYVIIDKRDNEKYQLHAPSGQFADRHDEMLTMGEIESEFPGIWEVLPSGLRDEFVKNIRNPVDLSPEELALNLVANAGRPEPWYVVSHASEDTLARIAAALRSHGGLSSALDRIFYAEPDHFTNDADAFWLVDGLTRLALASGPDTVDSALGFLAIAAQENEHIANALTTAGNLDDLLRLIQAASDPEAGSELLVSLLRNNPEAASSLLRAVANIPKGRDVLRKLLGDPSAADIVPVVVTAIVEPYRKGEAWAAVVREMLPDNMPTLRAADAERSGQLRLPIDEARALREQYELPTRLRRAAEALAGRFHDGLLDRLPRDSSVPTDVRYNPVRFVVRVAENLPESLRMQPSLAGHALSWLLDRYVRGAIPSADLFLHPESFASKLLAIWAVRHWREKLELPDELDGLRDLRELAELTLGRRDRQRDHRRSAEDLIREAQAMPHVARATVVLAETPYLYAFIVGTPEALDFWTEGTRLCEPLPPGACHRIADESGVVVILRKDANDRFLVIPEYGAVTHENGRLLTIDEIDLYLPNIREIVSETKWATFLRSHRTSRIPPRDMAMLLDYHARSPGRDIEAWKALASGEYDREYLQELLRLLVRTGWLKRVVRDSLLGSHTSAVPHVLAAVLTMATVAGPEAIDTILAALADASRSRSVARAILDNLTTVIHVSGRTASTGALARLYANLVRQFPAGMNQVAAAVHVAHPAVVRGVREILRREAPHLVADFERAYLHGEDDDF